MSSPTRCRQIAATCRCKAKLSNNPDEWLLLAEYWEIAAMHAELLASWDLPIDQREKEPTLN
jgi:hypothetical protein